MVASLEQLMVEMKAPWLDPYLAGLWAENSVALRAETRVSKMVDERVARLEILTVAKMEQNLEHKLTKSTLRLQGMTQH